MGVASTIAKNTVFNFIATASDLLINFVVSIVLARSLGTEQYGLYALLIWFLGFATLAVNLGLGSMTIRFVAEALGRQRRDEAQGLVRLLLTYRGLAGVVIFLAIIIFSGFWAKQLADTNNQIYFILLAFVFLPNIVNLTLISIFSGFQKYEYNAYLMLGTNPLRAILIIVLAILGFGIEQLLTANIIAWVIGIFVGIFLLRKLIPLRTFLSIPPLSSAVKRSALKYALTMLGVLGVSYFLAGEAAVLLLGLFRPVEEVGFYTLASKLPAMVMMLIPSVFSAVLLPAIAEQFGKGDMEKLKTIYLTSARYLMILGLPLAAGGIALAGPIITLLYGADYIPVIILMQILFVPSVIKPITEGAIVTIQGIKQPAFLFKVGGFLACLNIGLNLLLIPSYGTLGAALATSVPLLLSLPFYIRFVRNKIGVSWPLADTVKIALASLFMGLVVFVLQVYLNTYLSLIVCIPLGVILYVVAIIVLKVINEQDLIMFKERQNLLPTTLHKFYSTMLSTVERLVIR